MALDIGRVCVKKKGREAGFKAAVVEVDKEGFVVIDGPKVKRRKCNPRHLLPTQEALKISKDAKHEEIVKLMEKK